MTEQDLTNFFDKSFWQSVVATLAASILILLLKRLADWASVTLFKGHPRSRNVGLIGVLCIWSLLTILYVYYSWPFPAFFILLMTVTLGFVIWKELSQFWNSGLISLDRTIKTGVDYDKALQLCTNQLDFLGIGASKLTQSSEFENAIRRCHRPNIPIRFLLTKPNNQLLIKAAQHIGTDPQDYQKRVAQSLGVLGRLRNDKHMNIEVRFYPSDRQSNMPLFRLMFINNSICLMSYNIFGEGDGSQLPQLHLKRSDNQRDTDSFYYPFRLFFDLLWQDSEPWDFDLQKLNSQ